jgi:hypothetical protein
MNNYNDTKAGGSMPAFGVPNESKGNMFTLNTIDGTAMINGLGQVKVFYSERDALAYAEDSKFDNLRPTLIQIVSLDESK